MGGIAHYLEDEGLATTQISLIIEHTQTIRPPRALWVPFELGRPFGAPDEPEFQTRVLVSTLKLLEAKQGPVLDVFPEDAPGTMDETAETLSCPVSFAAPEGEKTPTDQLLQVFEKEIGRLRGWYDLAVETRGRTTAGTTGLLPEEAADLLAAYIRDGGAENPVADVSLATALRMAAEDIKAYYLEAVSAQPGQPRDSRSLADWFWGQTAAARVINMLREICLTSDDKEFRILGKLLLIPRAQMHRFETK